MRSKNATYNVITNLLLQIIILAYGFIVPKIIISNFGSNVNGLVSSITQFLGYITLLESGFGPVVKASLYKPIAKKDKQSITNILYASESFFRKLALVFVFYIIVLTIVYPIIVNNSFNFIFTSSLIIIISISTLAEYFFGMTYKLYLEAEQKGYVISIIQIITYILSISGVIIAALLGCTVHTIKIITGLFFVVRPIIQNLYVKKKYNIVLKEADKNYQIKNKWDGLAQHIAYVIHSNTDITILTLFCTLSEVSVYAVYYLVIKGIKQIIQSFSSGIDATFGDMLAKDEKSNLNNKFNMYELIYLSIITIVFTCTIILITPFITVYTKEITDTNYIRYTFGYLLVISEFIWAIRLPYSSITTTAGHFKQTRKGAWVEAIVNIILSLILVIRYGIIGVAIGTIVAMTIRTIEFIIYANKNILERNIMKTLKKIFVITIDSILIFLIFKNVNILPNVSYLSWTISSLFIFGITTLVVLMINLLFFEKDIIEIIKFIKDRIKSKKRKNVI